MIDLGNFYSVINFLNSVADFEFLFNVVTKIKNDSPTPGIEPGPPG